MTGARFIQSRARPTTPRYRRAGLTVIEAVLSTMVLSLMVVAVLNTVGATSTTKMINSQRDRALLLAQELMAEIVQQSYEDPSGSILIGVDAAEGTSNRNNFDDVDDYDGWDSSPPEYADGTPIPWATGFRRKVDVVWSNPSNLNQKLASETGVKRITITVFYDQRRLVLMHALRTNALPDPLEGVEMLP